MDITMATITTSNRKSRLRKAILLSIIAIFSFQTSNAQCEYPNSAFKAGEKLDFDLYFNWKFVWVKVGSTHYKITDSTYSGKKALRTDLIFKSNKACDKFFPMRDTLVSYSSDKLVPYYFRKGANEGKRYTVDEVKYSYSEDGKIIMKMRYKDPDGKWTDKTLSSTECINDMLNILALSRSMDFSSYKVNQRTVYRMVTGKRMSNQILVYKGKKNFKANDDKTYRCLVFSLLNDKSKKEEELLKFYITDDKNHLPVRIDFHLNFGEAVAKFKSGSGIRNAQTAIVKK